MRALFKTLELKNSFRTSLKKSRCSSTFKYQKKLTDNSSAPKNSHIIWSPWLRNPRTFSRKTSKLVNLRKIIKFRKIKTFRDSTRTQLHIQLRPIKVETLTLHAIRKQHKLILTTSLPDLVWCTLFFKTVHLEFTKWQVNELLISTAKCVGCKSYSLL